MAYDVSTNGDVRRQHRMGATITTLDEGQVLPLHLPLLYKWMDHAIFFFLKCLVLGLLGVRLGVVGSSYESNIVELGLCRCHGFKELHWVGHTYLGPSLFAFLFAADEAG